MYHSLNDNHHFRMITVFPREIIDSIIDLHSSDSHTLVCVSLVCRAWYPRTRIHLFKQLSLSGHDDYLKFRGMFKDSQHLAPYISTVALGAELLASKKALQILPWTLSPFTNIRTLVLNGPAPWMDSNHYALFDAGLLSTIGNIVRDLSTVSTLVIRSWFFNKPACVHRLLPSNRSLKCLVLDKVIIECRNYSSFEEPEKTSSRSKKKAKPEIPAPPVRQALEGLTLSMNKSAKETFVKSLDCEFSHIDLHNIRILRFVDHSPNLGTPEWQSILSAASTTIEYLQLGFISPDYLLDWHNCLSLRTLRLDVGRDCVYGWDPIHLEEFLSKASLPPNLQELQLVYHCQAIRDERIKKHWEPLVELLDDPRFIKLSRISIQVESCLDPSNLATIRRYRGHKSYYEAMNDRIIQILRASKKLPGSCRGRLGTLKLRLGLGSITWDLIA
ncbi:hypothetical protein BDQ17DRAFT_1428799 [Cyathus striatus]|nr:hypothetical protein BDQ17DRAFT_1428799 [Cyathus striatus]